MSSPEHWPRVAIHPATSEHLVYRASSLAVNYELIQATLLNSYGVGEEDARGLVIMAGPPRETDIAPGYFSIEGQFIYVSVEPSLRYTNSILWHEICHAARWLLGHWDHDTDRQEYQMNGRIWWEEQPVEKRLEYFRDIAVTQRVQKEVEDYKYKMSREERKARKYQKAQEKHGRENYALDYEEYMEDPQPSSDYAETLALVLARTPSTLAIEMARRSA